MRRFIFIGFDETVKMEHGLNRLDTDKMDYIHDVDLLKITLHPCQTRSVRVPI